MADLDGLVNEAHDDPAVVGLVLTGSHARGLATPHSDIDVCVVVGERGGSRWLRRRTAEVDEFVCTVDELADTSDIWQRYTFRGCRVLLDRPDGLVAELVHRQAVPTEAEARRWARDGLDGYVNFLYRAAKSRRDGEPVAAALDTAESISWLLTTVFALYGRLRPYNKYLRWELTTYPLPEPWTAATLPERAAARPGRALSGCRATGPRPRARRRARRVGRRPAPAAAEWEWTLNQRGRPPRSSEACMPYGSPPNIVDVSSHPASMPLARRVVHRPDDPHRAHRRPRRPGRRVAGKVTDEQYRTTTRAVITARARGNDEKRPRTAFQLVTGPFGGACGG